MTDYVITAGRSASYPRNHYGCHLIGGRATFCEDADLRNPDANVLAMPDPPVSVLSSSPVSVGANFFGAHISSRSNDDHRRISVKTVRSHDMTGGKGRWQIIQPTSSTNTATWDLSALDAWVDTNYAAGRDMVFTLYATPSWASARPSETNSYAYGTYGSGTEGVNYGNYGLAAEPSNLTYWDTYCTKIAQRYVGKIKYYEVWNEPNLIGFYTGTQTILAQMTRRANVAIKAVDPTAKIISPPVQGWLASGTDTSGAYLTGMMAASDGASGTMKDWVDIVGVHLYTDSAATALSVATDRAVAARAAAGLTTKELWDTESGPIAVKAPFMTDWQMRAYLTRFMITLAAKGVSRTMYYQYDSAAMGFSGRGVVEASWEGVRTLLMSGGILAASRLSDGRVAYWTSNGMTII